MIASQSGCLSEVKMNGHAQCKIQRICILLIKRFYSDKFCIDGTVFGALGNTSKITVTGHMDIKDVKCSCVLEAKVQIAAGDRTVVH